MSLFENPHPSTSTCFSITNKIPEFKVILVGNSGVGKTCIVVRVAKEIY